MHTLHRLSADRFEYRRAGEPVDRGEVMPELGQGDRLGVVMAGPTDGLGAGHFVLSCVIAFYDHVADLEAVGCEYPDFYTFQATDQPADYLELDVWPDHKNVAVPADPEAILRAVNDRAIDVLLVPDGPAGDVELDGATRRSAERGIDTCVRYAPDGDLADAGFSIRLPRDPAEEWYRATAATTDAPGARFEPALADETGITQRYRRVGLEEALAALPTG